MALPQQVRIAHRKFEARAAKVDKAVAGRSMIGVPPEELLLRMELLLKK